MFVWLLGSCFFVGRIGIMKAPRGIDVNTETPRRLIRNSSSFLCHAFKMFIICFMVFDSTENFRVNNKNPLQNGHL